MAFTMVEVAKLTKETKSTTPVIMQGAGAWATSPIFVEPLFHVVRYFAALEILQD